MLHAVYHGISGHICLLLDSQGSADTPRSQHTDVTSELSSVMSAPDKTCKCIIF